MTGPRRHQPRRCRHGIEFRCQPWTGKSQSFDPSSSEAGSSHRPADQVRPGHDRWRGSSGFMGLDGRAGNLFRPDQIRPISPRIEEGNVLGPVSRSEEHTSELQSLMRISYAVFCLKKKNNIYYNITHHISVSFECNSTT